jgi:hypothetical protein
VYTPEREITVSRELYRVPLDFDWPLRKVWKGFINPYYQPCPEEANGKCFRGQTAAGEWLSAICHLLGMIGEEAEQNTPEQLEHFKRVGRIYPHPCLAQWPQVPVANIPRGASKQEIAEYLRKPPKILPLDAELADFIKKLAKEETLRYSSRYSIRCALLAAAGITDEEWGLCQVCHGEGHDPATKDQREAWKKTPPPAGEGWQIWETVSEGSPVSNVYATKEELIAYLISQGYTENAAENFCEGGWVPSAVIRGGKIYKDIESAEIL